MERAQHKTEINELADQIYETDYDKGALSDATLTTTKQKVNKVYPDAEYIDMGYGRIVLYFNTPPHRSLTQDEEKIIDDGIVIKIAYNNCKPDGDDGSLQNSTELYYHRDANISLPLAPILDYQQTGGEPRWVMMPARLQRPSITHINRVIEENMPNLPRTNDLYSKSSWGMTTADRIECIDYGRLSV